MLIRNRMLGGSMFQPLYAAEDGSGGGAPGAGAGGAADAGAVAAAAAPAAAAAAKPGSETLAGSGGGSDAAAAAAKPAGFPDNWRDLLAGGDKDAAKDLAKYTDPTAVYKTARQLQADLSSGKLKRAPEPLAANATDEQKAEWRKANGLPETAEAYVKGLKLPDGVVVGEADKPLVDNFAKALFEQGGTQEEMNRSLSFYYGLQDKLQEQQKEADGDFRVNSEVALKGEWGADFKPNMAAFGAFKSQIPEDVQAILFSARTVDGRLVGDTPEFMKIGAIIGRELNPAAAVVLQGAGDAKGVDSEIASIEATFRKATSGDSAAHREYYGHDGQPGLEVRYRTLLDTRDKMTKRGQAA